MSGGTPLSRRRAIGLLARTAATLAGIRTAHPAPLAPHARPAGLDISTIVALHLDQLARCGMAGAHRAARLRPVLTGAARRHPGHRGRRPAETAFALMEQFGEFPPVHDPPGGSQ